MIAAALERRVWARTGKYRTFANLYIMLVGAPGIGKQIIDEARYLWAGAPRPGTNKPAFHLSSDSCTRASLIDELLKAKQTILPPEGTAVNYHSLMLMQEEIRVLLPMYDREFISRLDKLYNAPDDPPYRETRRTGPVREVSIEKPILNVLLGAQPAYLADTFPENAWATGSGRRLIMIYAAESPITSVFDDPGDIQSVRDSLRHQLSIISELYGQTLWDGEAAELLREWDMDWQQYIKGDSQESRWPIPSHSRLVHYCRSRTMFVIKLAICAAVASRCELVIRRCDIERALGWLLTAEELMPDIFREMRGQSDREVLEELHRFALTEWARNKRQPVKTPQLLNFLSYRVPSLKVDQIMSLAERADVLARVAGTTDQWVPRPSFDRRVE